MSAVRRHVPNDMTVRQPGLRIARFGDHGTRQHDDTATARYLERVGSDPYENGTGQAEEDARQARQRANLSTTPVRKMKRVLKELRVSRIAAVDRPCQEHALATILKRDFSADERSKLADTGAAMPDGSFPIKTTKDLENAIHLAGRAKDPAAAKAHIIARAKSLGAESSLPDDWIRKDAADGDPMPDEEVEKQVSAMLDRLNKAKTKVQPGATHTTMPIQRGAPLPEYDKRVCALRKQLNKAWSDAAREAAAESRRGHGSVMARQAPSMTKQHFQMIADTLSHHGSTVRVDPVAHGALVGLFADRLAKTNPKFDKAKFIAAATKRH